VTDQPTRILAVDFGDRRTGLAATDFTGTIVTPLPALVGLPDHECATAIAALAAERDTQVVVVGLPLTSTGEEGPRAKRTMTFVKLLARTANCEVTTFDERNTTDEAHALLAESGMKAARRRRYADSVAALVILKRFLA
jgi:putative pre-16S rRNA nuclease